MAQDIYKMEFTEDEMRTLRVALTRATKYVSENDPDIAGLVSARHDRLWFKLIKAKVEQDKMPAMETIYDESGIAIGECALLKDQAE